jgi:hypothetical protein
VRHTLEQLEARRRLAELVGQAGVRYRVVDDSEGWPVVAGRLGQIEPYCHGVDCHSCPIPKQPALAVYTDRPRLFAKLWAIPGVRRHQVGAGEIRAVFPADLDILRAVCSTIRARVRRLPTPGAVERLSRLRAVSGAVFAGDATGGTQ